MLVQGTGFTGLDANAAVDAGERIVPPGGRLLIDSNAAGRAFSGTNTAERTGSDIVVDGATRLGKRRSDNHGIAPGGAFGEEVL